MHVSVLEAGVRPTSSWGNLVLTQSSGCVQLTSSDTANSLRFPAVNMKRVYDGLQAGLFPKHAQDALSCSGASKDLYCMPNLQVGSITDVSFPLGQQASKELQASDACAKCPGCSGAFLVPPDRFVFANPAWSAGLEVVVDKVKKTLGINTVRSTSLLQSPVSQAARLPSRGAKTCQCRPRVLTTPTWRA